jgi:ribonuclease P protein component
MREERRAESVYRFDEDAAIDRFPREYRLTEKHQFDAVLSARTIQLRSGSFRLYATSNKEAGARLGLIVGKRQLKRAVDRNRVKRVLRETFRVRRTILPAYDIVVQLADRPRGESVSGEAASIWPRLLSAFGTTNDQRSA